eukprot:gene372-97_t
MQAGKAFGHPEVSILNCLTSKEVQTGTLAQGCRDCELMDANTGHPVPIRQPPGEPDPPPTRRPANTGTRAVNPRRGHPPAPSRAGHGQHPGNLPARIPAAAAGRGASGAFPNQGGDGHGCADRGRLCRQGIGQDQVRNDKDSLWPAGVSVKVAPKAGGALQKLPANTKVSVRIAKTLRERLSHAGP